MTNIIRTELETRLAAFAAAQLTPVLVSYEGVPFIKPANFTPFLQCFLVPNITMNTDISGSHNREYGIFHVNVWTQEGVGSGAGEALAQGVADAFPIVPKIGTVSIEQTPHISAAILDNGWRVMPVTIKYRKEV